MATLTQAFGCIYEFDDVRVEPLTHRLFKAGREIAVEPKLYGVLVEFLARPNQVLTRDELLDAVWGHRHVTPAALSRVVTLLRKAIGDQPENPRYIQTVPTLGYRFITSVRVIPPDNPMPVSVAANVVKQGAVIIASTEPLPATESSSADGRSLDGKAVDALAPPLRPKTAALRWMPALGLAVAAIAVWGWRSHVGGDAAAGPARIVTVAVLPLAAPAGDDELHTAAEGFSESLIESLSHIAALRVTGRESAFAISSTGSADPKQTAATLGVDNVVSGDIEPRGAQLQLRLSLWRRGASPPETIVDKQVPRVQLFRSLPLAMERIEALLTNHVPPAADNGIALSAQDLYFLGRHYWNEGSQTSLLRALDYFERAVAADPRDALAYCGLVETYALLAPTADLSSEQMVENASKALAHAKLLAPDLADVLAAEGLHYMNQGDRANALPAFKRALEKEPHHPLALRWYGEELFYAGRIREAIKSHAQAVEFDPLNAQLHDALALDYVFAGDEEQANQHIQRALELNPVDADAYDNIGMQDELHGRMAAAATAYSEERRRRQPANSDSTDLARAYLRAGATDLAERALATDLHPDSLHHIHEQAFVDMAQGHFAEALNAIELICPGPAIVDECTTQRARLLALLGRREEALSLYSAVFSDSVESGEHTVKHFPYEFYSQHFTSWLALLPVGSSARNRGIEVFGAELDRLADNGVELSGMSYQRAVYAALKGDENSASRYLDAAIAGGWLNAPAIDRDLVWQPYAHADWLLASRARVAALAAKEREMMQAGLP